MKGVVTRVIPWWPLVDRVSLRGDALAGLLGALLVLPQGVAFATLAGLPPQYGLYTAIVPAILAALFGSSRHAVAGPTNALSLALLAMLAPLALPGSASYIELVLCVTVLVGLLQLGLGLARMGLLANFISPSVLLGFTCGAATLIGIHALRNWFGLQMPTGSSAAEVLLETGERLLHPQTLSWAPLLIGGITIAVALLARRFDRRLPFMLIGLLAGFAAGQVIAVYTPVAMLGHIPVSLPTFRVPAVDWARIDDLLGIAAAITIIALGQSVSIAKTIALRSGQQIDVNREFVGQGLSNLVGGFFSSYVSCGSLNRSVPNFETGARTPLSVVFAALWLMVLVALTSNWLARIPLAAIAALLVLVAWSLFDVKRIREIARQSRTELGIVLVTLVATLLIRMEMAILLGVAISLITYLYRTAHPALRPMVPDTDDPGRRLTPLDELARPHPECPQFKLARIEGEIYFGAVQHVSDRLEQFRAERAGQKHLLVMSRSMNFVDFAGIELWQREMNERRKNGGDLYFHRPRSAVMRTWEQSGFAAELGRDHVFATKGQAIGHIVKRLDPAICAQCRVRIFNECTLQPAPSDLA